MERFGSVLGQASESVDEAVNYDLEYPEGTEKMVKLVETPADMKACATNQDHIKTCGDIVCAWTEQYRRVMMESEQMRSESDDVGPRVELDYWRSRNIKFNIMLEKINTKTTKHILGVLNIAKSRHLSVWFDLENKITNG